MSIDGGSAVHGAGSTENTTGAGGVGGAGASGNSVNGSTKFNSMAELREKEPKLYTQMVLGIGMGICNQSRRAQERNHQLMKEAQRNGN